MHQKDEKRNMYDDNYQLVGFDQLFSRTYWLRIGMMLVTAASNADRQRSTPFIDDVLSFFNVKPSWEQIIIKSTKLYIGIGTPKNTK